MSFEAGADASKDCTFVLIIKNPAPVKLFWYLI